MIALRISDKEWKKIEFRKNKFRELESALDQAVSGRDNKVPAFLSGALAGGEMGKATAVEKLVNELVKSMDSYGIRNRLWIESDETIKDNGLSDDDFCKMKATEEKASEEKTSEEKASKEKIPCMPTRFKEFIHDYLYCMILLMTSEMEWVEQIYAEPYADSFQQLYLHAKRVREFSVRPIEKRYDELWGETYFGVRGASGLFEIFSMAYESITGKDIGDSLTQSMKDGLDTYCQEQMQMYDEFLDEAEDNAMTDEEIEEAISEYVDVEEDTDMAELNRYFDELAVRWDESEKRFRQEFPDTEGFCARYMKLRELFYTDESRDIRYPLTIFDILVEGMLDVFLGRRGMTLYTDADNCARAYISIKKQIDAIKKLWEEA